MKEKVREIILRKIPGPFPPFEIERPALRLHGDFSTNLALLLGRERKEKPVEVAKKIAALLGSEKDFFERIEVAGPGFINFFLKKSVWQESLREIEQMGDRFGECSLGKGKKVLVEFVSANPTGPIHIGNARGGPLGDMIAALLETTGYEVTREYYVNDVGGQIDKLGESILASRKGGDVIGYQGDYVKDLAEASKNANVPDDKLGLFGIELMLKEIQRDCDEMGIRFDSWIHEKEILDSGKTNKAFVALKEKGVVLEKEGAWWLATQDEFLQDRECVLVRSDGRPTYFANDIAYHADKYRRNFDRIINIWGSNHHGHIPRLQAAMKSLGFDPNKMETVLYQYVRVKRGNEAIKMSKRGGNFVTAREVLDEVGKDAFRFFLLMRAPESHLDFDLELAKTESQENPVYYVQYAHARLASLFRKAVEKGVPFSPAKVNLSLLDLPEEIDLIQLLHLYPDEILLAATRLEPHRIPFYLLELARAFQSYYSKAKEDDRYLVVGRDVDTSQAKMYLCAQLKKTIAKGLKLIGVSAPEVMHHE